MTMLDKKINENKTLRDVVILFIALCVFSFLALLTMFYV